MRRRHHERGASFVLVMGIILVLTMFVAAGVSLGRLVIVRHDCQDAADAAALAYAEAIIQNQGVYPPPGGLARARAVADANLGDGVLTSLVCAERRAAASLHVDCNVTKVVTVPRYLYPSGSLTVRAAATASLPPVDVSCTDRFDLWWSEGWSPIVDPGPTPPLGHRFVPFVEIQGWDHKPHADGGWNIRLPPPFASGPFTRIPVFAGSDFVWARYCVLGIWSDANTFSINTRRAVAPPQNAIQVVQTSRPAAPADGEIIALHFIDGFNTGWKHEIFGFNVHGDDDMGWRTQWLDPSGRDSSGLRIELISANEPEVATSGDNAMFVSATALRLWLPPTYRVDTRDFVVHRNQPKQPFSFVRDESFDRQALLISVTTYDPAGHKKLPFLAECDEEMSRCTVEAKPHEDDRPCTDESEAYVCLPALEMLCDDHPIDCSLNGVFDGDQLSVAWQDEDQLWDNLVDLMCDMFKFPFVPIGFCNDFANVRTWDDLIREMRRADSEVADYLEANRPPEPGENAYVAGRITQIQWSSRPWLVR